MRKQYKSDAMAAIHESMDSLHNIGAIDNQTMRHFDEACLTPSGPLKPEEIGSVSGKQGKLNKAG